MYSVVLITAITAGSQTADFGWRHRGHGCHGAAYSCYGCYGGSYGGYGGGGYGCYGCYGWSGPNACYGPALPYACYGYRVNHSYQCHGCYGCYGCYALPGNTTYNPVYTPVSPYVAPPVYQQPVQEPPVQKQPVQKRPPKKKKTAPAPDKKKSDIHFEDRAMVVLEVPADAVVYVDGQRMKSSSTKRVFVTPELEPGKTYYYDVKAEVVRDSETIASSRRIFLRVGQQLPLSFANLMTPDGPAIAQSK